MKPPIRAKFRCTQTTNSASSTYQDGKHVPCVVTTYKFQVVGGDTPENKAFFASTPSGTLDLGVVHDGLFEIGKEYFLDFTPSEA